MKNKTIELTGGPKDDHLLHADGDRAVPLAKKVMDFIHEQFRELNSDVEDVENKLLCGGCLNTLIINLHSELLERSGASRMDAADHFSLFRDDMEANILSALGIDPNDELAKELGFSGKVGR